MKKLIVLLFILISCRVGATSISSATVSGHWTLSGSPYLINNDIKIDSFSTLVIDSGVSVLFQGPYRLTIDGVLIASGTPTNPIIFSIGDTTGFSTDSVTSAGAWHGVQFNEYGGTAFDSSIIKYCNFSYVKIDSAIASTMPSTFFVNRDLTVLYSGFTMFKTAFNASVNLFALNSNHVLEFGYNTFNGNFSNSPLMAFWNYGGGYTYIHDNKIYDNRGKMGIISCNYVNMLFENNDLYQNMSYGASYGNATLYMYGMHATIKGNRFHNNTNYSTGAMYICTGFVDIIDNLICNNTQTAFGCGAVEGGGGIWIGNNSGLPADSMYYTVRNNIFANNYASHDGGAIYTFFAKAKICNNDFINNSSFQFGAIHYSTDSTTPFIVKNNIFYGNKTGGSGNYPQNAGFVWGTFEFDHNWSPYPFYLDEYIVTSYTFGSDTLTNVMGTDPGLIAPTLTDSVSESALTANFGLSSTSGCINAGDTSFAFADSLDYLHHSRIIGGIIDIGAIEYLHPPVSVPVMNKENISISLYPNPSSNVLFVRLPEQSGFIEILDFNGKSVAMQQVANKLCYINVYNFVPGNYIVNWIDNGIVKGSSKLIVSK